LCFGLIKVILDERLFDESFVSRWTVGYDAFRARVDQIDLAEVSSVTGVDADLIARAARLYASSTPAVIPWTPITDQQRTSTSAIRLMCTLRAICGNLDVRGGELLHGFHPDIVSESELEMHEALSDQQRAKQLGRDTHPAFTYRGTDPLRGPTHRVWGYEWANIVSGSYMANPTAVFKAMVSGAPYPVKALFSLGNNTLLSFPNMQLTQQAILAQDLVVAFEHVRTPTAQLADYVLPGDSWLERNALSDSFGWTAIYRTSQKVVEPPGECRGVYDFWRDLAHRVGLGEHFPWRDHDELLNHRVHRLAPSFSAFAADHAYHAHKHQYRKYEATGFATPSGKVELSSSVLEGLGFDPLPYWRNAPPADKAWPLTMFTGVREDEYFQTGHRHIPALRERQPVPLMFISPQDAAILSITDGAAVRVVTPQGRVRLVASIQASMQQGCIRVPHGWWMPERPEGDGTLSGAWDCADAQICPDDDGHMDREQGVPHLKGIACRVEIEGV
jgi:anaerobic selenocysteine-containing dehydrogenase